MKISYHFILEMSTFFVKNFKFPNSYLKFHTQNFELKLRFDQGKSSEKFDKRPKIAYHFKAEKYNRQCGMQIQFSLGIETELRQKRGDVNETHISTTSSKKEK